MKNFIFNKIYYFMFLIILKLSKKNHILKKYNPLRINSNKKAILYYKYSIFNEIILKNEVSTRTLPLFIAKLLNDYGYVVTIVDRKYNKILNLKKYDVIMGIINSGSANLFLKTLQHNENILVNKKIIGISTGAESSIMKERYLQALEKFNLRNNVKFNSYERFANNSYSKILKKINYLFYHGYQNGFVHNSYNKYNIKKYNLITPISNLPVSLDEIKSKKINKNNFIFFSGSGFIHKGLDVVVETFKKNKHLNLYIFISNKEKNFEKFYDLKNIRNVHYFTNINVRDQSVKKIFLNSAFLIAPSCTGGSSAAVAEAMRYGLIPIITRSEDNNFKYSIILEDNSIASLENAISVSIKLDEKKLQNLAIENFKLSFENSKENYNKLLTRGFNEIFFKD